MLESMLYRNFGITLILLLATVVRGQPTSPTSLPAGEPIPPAALDAMIRRELGESFRPADAEKLRRVLPLIDRYFSSAADRPATVKSLDGLGLNANLIGRLTRLRANWPDLAGGVYYINEKMSGHDTRYFLGIPKGYDRTKPWPLVIKLPTADAFIGDPRPDPVQVTEIYSAWMRDELAAHPDAVLIMPLLNLDALWGPSYEGMDNVIQPMLHAFGRVNIDPSHVYMLGHSMSGHAVWNLAMHYSTYFAAFDALAGSASADWQRLRLMNLRNVLSVAWQDANDDLIKLDVTRQNVKLLRDLKCDVDFTETRSVGHTPTAEIVDQTWQKTRARARPLYPQRVSIQSNRPDTMFNRNDWVQIYQPLNTGAEHRLAFGRVPGVMTVYDSPFSVDATISKNVITVTSKNVTAMRFYVNDQMVDFSRAVSVVVNNRPRFEAILTPSIDSMLKDQLFLGRGWRYYTGVIDITFGDTPATRPTTRGRISN